MFVAIRQWVLGHETESELPLFFATLTVLIALLYWFGALLMPGLIALVLAYLFNPLLTRIKGYGLPHLASVLVVFFLFLGLMAALLTWLLPLIGAQTSHLFVEAPSIINAVQVQLQDLHQAYPNYVTDTDMLNLMQKMKAGVSQYGTQAVMYTLSFIPSLLQIVVYFVLVPMLVFFYMKDKEQLSAWISSYLPNRRQLLNKVWDEVNIQLGHYLRGKVMEVGIIGAAAFVIFAIFGLKYTLLLSVLVGVTTLLPIVGVLIVSVPVVLIAFWQWGPGSQLTSFLVAYGVLQLLDANVLVPLLFSEAMNIHPVAILLALIFFGGVFGFWGVFFAIPLATVVNSLLKVVYAEL